MPRNVIMYNIIEWDDLVTSTYNKPYSFLRQEGYRDRGIYPFCVPIEYIEDYEDHEYDGIEDDLMGVSFKSWLNADLSNLSFQEKRFCETKFFPNVSMIIEDLYKKGILKEGEYIINIDW